MERTQDTYIGKGIRTDFPPLRTFMVADPSEGRAWKAVTGLIVPPMKRKEHEQEFPGLYRYNLGLGDAEGGVGWRKLNDRITDRSTLLYTAEPVEMYPTEHYEGARLGYVMGRETGISADRKPTREEVESFCAHPRVAPALEGFPKGYLPFDADGRRILPAGAWNALVETAAKDELMKRNLELMKSTITAVVTGRDGKTFKADFNLAGPLQRIIDAGFHTGQSDSGTVSDHPNYRYVEDGPDGLYRKGEPVVPGAGAYLTFWAPGAEGVHANTEEQVRMIRDSALATGWSVREMPIFGQPSIRLALPETNDLLEHTDISREAAELMRQKHPGLTMREDFEGYFAAKSAIEEELVARHGGRIGWTDSMVIDRWDAFARNLAWRRDIAQATGRVTGNDVHSVLLDKETSGKLEAEHLANRTAIVKGFKPALELYRRLQAEAYDKAARDNGFGGYEENREGTGVRDYTSGHKRPDAGVIHRLEAFNRERDLLMKPVDDYFRRYDARLQRQLQDEGQRYLQAVHAVTAPLARAREDGRRISDVSVYASGPEYDRRYSIRCRIDGEQQSGKRLTAKDGQAWRDGAGDVDVKELAARYFRQELDNGREREQARGMRR